MTLSKRSSIIALVIATFAAIFIATMPLKAYAADQGYAVLDTSGTLTFLHSSEAHANGATDSATGSTWYTVSDSGDYLGYQHVAGPDYDSVQKIVFQDTFAPTQTSSWFNGMIRLQEIDNPQNLDFSHVTDASLMFDGCRVLPSVDVSSWDTSQVTNMNQMFNDCPALTSLDVSGWDVSHVTDMQNMFKGCSSLVSIDFTNWNTSAVTTMRAMFSGCSVLPDSVVATMNSWNVSSLEDIHAMFLNCDALVNPNSSGWGATTSHIQTISLLFANCNQIQTVNLSGWDTQSLQDMSKAWYDNSSLKQQPIGIDAWNTSSVTNLEDMFYNCPNLPELLLPNWDTHNVLNMSHMLYYNRALETIDFSNWNTQNATDLTDALGTNTSDTYGNLNLKKATFGTQWSFKGATTDASKWAILETPAANDHMSGKWAEDDAWSTPQYTPTEVQAYENFNAEPHTWYWGQIGVTYDLTYDANGGVDAPAAQTVPVDYLADNPTHDFVLSDQTPTRDGYTFVGWSDVQDPADTDTLYKPGDTYTVVAPASNGDASAEVHTILYAQWDENPAPAIDDPDEGGQPEGRPEPPSARFQHDNGADSTPEGSGEGAVRISLEQGNAQGDASAEEQNNVLAETADPMNVIALPFVGIALASGCAALAIARKKNN